LQQSISRRGFLARTAPVVATVVPVAAQSSAWGATRRKKKTKKPYFVLQPEYVQTAECNVRERNKPRGCHGCKACHKHAKNKIFATRKAANKEKNRAHPGCKCKVIRGGKFKNEVWLDLFGGSLDDPNKKVVDRRKRRVKRILNRAFG
jgi:hypothetical protein